MKTYKAIAVFILASFFLVSCDDILFEQPQPVWVSKNEATFPEKLRGIYTSDKEDTVLISAKSIGPLHPKPHDVIFTLSDSLLLRVDKDNYYLNIRADQYWDVTIGRIKGDSLITYTLTSKDDKNEEVHKALEGITHLKKNMEDSSNYVINPSSEEFRKILDKDLFRKADVYLKLKNKN